MLLRLAKIGKTAEPPAVNRYFSNFLFDLEKIDLPRRIRILSATFSLITRQLHYIPPPPSYLPFPTESLVARGAAASHFIQKDITMLFMSIRPLIQGESEKTEFSDTTSRNMENTIIGSCFWGQMERSLILLCIIDSQRQLNITYMFRDFY